MRYIEKRIYELIEERIEKIDEENYSYDNQLPFKLIPNKTVLKSFFEAYPREAADIFDEIFDEIHPH